LIGANGANLAPLSIKISFNFSLGGFSHFGARFAPFAPVVYFTFYVFASIF